MAKLNATIEKQGATIEEQHELVRSLEVDKQRLRDQLRTITNGKESEEEETEEEICSICRENLFSLPTTVLPRCGHLFHEICLVKYKEGVCPLCRTPIEEEFPPLPIRNF